MARQLAKSTVEKFQARLEEERVRLLGLIEDYEQELEDARLSESSSDRSPDPGNAEASSTKLEYAKELSIEQNTLDLLGKVERALEMVRAGSYGICESCGKSIPLNRLDVLPYATHCIDCARKA
ncbi:MAG TPA: TraR/DksA C4-type zinc finger protein [Acidimicrobiia bacterium]|nr:TraR/DksA C4-type zinc finger protein [Acidimicrobiia bacterium]